MGGFKSAPLKIEYAPPDWKKRYSTVKITRTVTCPTLPSLSPKDYSGAVSVGSKTMDDFKFNPEIQKHIENFNLDKYNQYNPNEETCFESSGLMEEIECDFSSFIMEISADVQEEVLKQKTKKPEPSKIMGPKSILTKKDQLVYTRDILNYRAKNKGLLPPTLSGVQKEVVSKVLQEQRQYSEYAIQLALNNVAQYNIVYKHVEEYFKHHLEYCSKRISNLMHQYILRDYQAMERVPFVNDPVPECKHTILLQKDHPIVIKRPSDGCNIPKFRFSSRSKSSSLLEDPYITELVDEWKPDIVLSVKSLKLFAGNIAPFPKEWEIPIVVQQKKGDDNVERQVLFVGKSLPSKSLNAREKSLTYFKRAVKHKLLNAGQKERKKSDSQLTKESIEAKQNVSEVPSSKFPSESDRSPDNDSRTPNESMEVEELAKTSKEAEKNISDTTQQMEPALKEPVYASSNEFSSLSDEDSERVESKSKSNVSSTSSIGAQTPAKRTPVPKGRRTKPPASDSDEDMLTIDGVTFDASSIPQLDGTGDRRKNTPRRVLRPKTEPGSAQPAQTRVLEIKEEAGSSTTKEISAAGSRSDIWMKSLSSEDKKSSSESAKAATASGLGRQQTITGLFSAWQKKQDKAAVAVKHEEEVSDSEEDRLILDEGDPDPPPDQAAETASSADDITPNDQTCITYGVTSDPAFATRIEEVASSTSAAAAGKGAQAILKTRASTKVAPLEKARLMSPPGKRAKPAPAARTLKVKLPDLRTRNTPTRPKPASGDGDSNRKEKTPEESDSPDDNIALSKLRTHLPPVAEKPPAARGGLSFPSMAATNLATAKPSAALRAKKTPRKDPTAAPKSDVLAEIIGRQNTTDHSVTTTPFSTQARILADKNPSDILGEILGMQKSKKPDRGSASNRRKRSTNEAECFDMLLAQHTQQRIRMVEKGEKQRFYALWCFGETRVLIRGGLHGVVELKKEGVQHVTPVTITTKLEYQSDLGYEQITFNEMCSEWVDLVFRPRGTAVLRCRFDPVKEKFMGNDFLPDLKSLDSVIKQAGFNVLKSRKALLSTFRKLTDKKLFPPGCYLISHKAGSVQYLVRTGVIKPPPRRAVYDLTCEYVNPGRFVETTTENVPYVPLDPYKQSRNQLRAHIAPMTFQPPLDTPHKKKKNKGKKKKKNKNRKSVEQS